MRPLTELRRDARAIFDAAVRAVEPADLVKRHFRRDGDTIEVAERRYDLSSYRHVYVVGAGKAAAAMGGAVERLLAERIDRAIVIVKYGHSLPLTKLKLLQAGHPVPDQNGLGATRELLEIVRNAAARDLILCLLSGGASALMVAPFAELTLDDKQATTRLLLGCGATIQEINTIRKHISAVKGGRLAQAAYPATVVTLILSDVIGDDVETVASGPFSPDSTTFTHCVQTLERCSLLERIPPRVRLLLESGVKGEIPETPKPGDAVFAKVQNLIIGNNRTALCGAQQHAAELGYNPMILSDPAQGEARQAALAHAAMVKELIGDGKPAGRPVCVISGGETTVTVRGNGRGGRNQEFALAAAMAIEGEENIVILSGGTDGSDGPTEAAGGIIDGLTVRRGKDRGLDPRVSLENNDSYAFLKATDDLLMTGPTLTNVMDLQLALVL
ncbi:MAG TPA: glycerate kinase [Candidatus Binatia bacterium]